LGLGRERWTSLGVQPFPGKWVFWGKLPMGPFLAVFGRSLGKGKKRLYGTCGPPPLLGFKRKGLDLNPWGIIWGGPTFNGCYCWAALSGFGGFPSGPPKGAAWGGNLRIRGYIGGWGIYTL